MKFGRNLPKNQVPEWSAEYVDYKGLKKIIKSAAEEIKQGREADLAAFFYTLDRNLDTVNAFYNKKFNDAARRLKLLSDRYHLPATPETKWHKEELDELVSALLELRGLLRKLQWYGEVNRRGFIKITKKLDKKIETACSQRPYLASRVDPKPFATNAQLQQELNKINDWLSVLTTISGTLDELSTTTSGSLSRRASKSALRFSPELGRDVELAIESDDGSALQSCVAKIMESESESSDSCQKILLHFLQRTVSCRAKRCLRVLLRSVETLNDEDDFNQRNCIHRLVISVGRARNSKLSQMTGQSSPELGATDSIRPAEAPLLLSNAWGLKEVDTSRLPQDSDDAAEFLEILFDELNDIQRAALSARDVFGRLPLHYAAKYGFVAACKVITDRMMFWKQINVSQGIDLVDWQDLEGNTPLHLSVIGGWRQTTEVLLNPFKSIAGDAVHRKPWSKTNELLLLAAKVDFFNTVRLLLEAGADINYRNELGDTALHIAAHFGYSQSGAVLLNTQYNANPAKLELPEKAFGWTPLLVASVDGHLSLVKMLLAAGADATRTDFSGWTAKEHAALRGHLDIVKILGQYTAGGTATEVNATNDGQHASVARSPIGERLNGNQGKDGEKQTVTNSFKSFGHRYLNKETMILVSLGSMDPRKSVKPVTLDNIPLAAAHATQLDTALSVIVSATGTSGEQTIVDLPIQDNINTEPMAFTAKDLSKVKLLFDIVPTYSGSDKNIIGRGAALLSSIKPTVGSKRMNLQGDLSVPIVAAKTLEIIGSVHFNFLIVTPFSHPNMAISERRTYWKKLSEPMVIGHRGLGKNMASRKSLQLGENTIQSFVAAANLGASYVEFDVQLTKDHVPVIYHDFLVSETGIDAPVHALTLEQFLHVNESNSPRRSRAPSPGDRYDNGTQTASDGPQTRPQRANSLSSVYDLQRAEKSDRMRHTRDIKNKGFKGNSRGNFISAPFTTLEEMLRKLPAHIGFNIEMKYPMLFETEEQEMDSYAVELNSFVDTVLQMVYDLGNGRNIIFSSFHPDICLLLSMKQPSIPILFLTDAGSSVVGDVRASSLQEAIRFASRWSLLGIVSAAEPLVACPRLVRVVKESGLVCVSYGTLNNEPANVQLQVNEGIDAVIVDSVLAIRRGLTQAADGSAHFLEAVSEGQPYVSSTDVRLAHQSNMTAAAC